MAIATLREELRAAVESRHSRSLSRKVAADDCVFHRSSCKVVKVTPAKLALRALIFASICSLLHAAPPVLDMLRRFGGNGLDQATALAVDGQHYQSNPGNNFFYSTGGGFSQFRLVPNCVTGALQGAAETACSLPAAIPEPQTWTLLILGFGVAGAVLRRVRRAAPA